jgi:dihydrodipicolinate reductase
MVYAIPKLVISQKSLIMNIALIGYGRMGHEIEAIAVKRGHLIKLIIDEDNTDDLNESSLESIDAAIEFSLPGVAFANVVKCLQAKVPVVSVPPDGWKSMKRLLRFVK